MRHLTRLFLIFLSVPALAQIETGPLYHPPVILTQGSRALALEAVTFRKEPFELNTNFNRDDPRGRIILFVKNIRLTSWEDIYAVSVEATDTKGTHYVQPERLDDLPNVPEVSALTIVLPELESGDVLVRVTWHGLASERARVGINKMGGGPPDEKCQPTNIVFDGDSLTRGIGSDYYGSYPEKVMQALGCGYEFSNWAVSGQTLVQMNQDAEAQIDTLIQPGRNILVGWGGTNDLARSGGNASVEDTYKELVTYFQNRRKAGYKVIVLTLLPRSDIFCEPIEQETKRTQFNELIRIHWREFADGIADVGSDKLIGILGDELDINYYATDRVHLIDKGYSVVAGYVYNTILSLGG